MNLPEKNLPPVLMTVDLEDWFQVENLRPAYPRKKWESVELRLEANTRLILNLFARHRVEATFFVLGWIAERCPGLIREISDRGHEVASHGYGHESCFRLSREILRDDLRRSKSLLEEITGKPVSGYRAPNFSVTQELLEVLPDLGFVYDSSYNDFALSTRNGRIEGLSTGFNQNDISAHDGLVELPVSNLRLGPLRVPWGGGGYFRFWPLSLYEWGARRILRKEGRYVFYFHPWEVDPGQPIIKNIGWVRRFRHYFNLSKTHSRLSHFLSTFSGHPFISCDSYLNGGLRY